MKRLVFGIFCLLFSVTGAWAQPGSFADLLNKVKGGDMSVDFRQFRYTFADKTPGEARVPDPKLHAQMLALLNQKKFKDAAAMAESVQKTHFVDMNSHVIAAMAYQGLGDAKKAKFHESVYVGLVNSILKDADGNTPKTAYTVISAAEEYVVLDALDLKRGTRETETVDGRTFHVLTATDKLSNQPVKIYFNIEKLNLSPPPVSKQ